MFAWTRVCAMMLCVALLPFASTSILRAQEVWCWAHFQGTTELCYGCEADFQRECLCSGWAQCNRNSAVDCTETDLFGPVPVCSGNEIDAVLEPCYEVREPCRGYPGCPTYPVHGYCLRPWDPSSYSEEMEWSFFLADACCP